MELAQEHGQPHRAHEPAQQACHDRPISEQCSESQNMPPAQVQLPAPLAPTVVMTSETEGSLQYLAADLSQSRALQEECTQLQASPNIAEPECLLLDRQVRRIFSATSPVNASLPSEQGENGILLGAAETDNCTLGSPVPHANVRGHGRGLARQRAAKQMREAVAHVEDLLASDGESEDDMGSRVEDGGEDSSEDGLEMKASVGSSLGAFEELLLRQ